jgi:hypothetical protein
MMDARSSSTSRQGAPAGVLFGSLLLLAFVALVPVTLAHATTAPGQTSLTVNSVDQNGKAIYGYDMVLYNSAGSIIQSGFTTTSFTLTSGQSYSVLADSYGACTFSHWSDGMTTNPRPFTAVDDAFLYTAVYNCLPSGSTVTVHSVDQSGNPIYGYYVTLWIYDTVANPTVTEVGSGFTTVTFPTTPGQLYALLADSYGSCSFSYWVQSPHTSGALQFMATENPQYFTAVYQCTSNTGSG